MRTLWPLQTSKEDERDAMREGKVRERETRNANWKVGVMCNEQCALFYEWCVQ